MDKWKAAQSWEKGWWNNCSNTFGEEMKQLLYAQKMGLVQAPDANTPFRFDLKGISVLDVGGGPAHDVARPTGHAGGRVFQQRFQVVHVLRAAELADRQYRRDAGT